MSTLRPCSWVCLLAVTWFAGCAVLGVRDGLTPLPPQVAIRPEATKDRVEFHLAYLKHATGLSYLTVTDADGRVLWQINGHSLDRIPVVVYGQVPSGRQSNIRQTHPEDGSPPPSLSGKRVKVEIGWRYHGHLGNGPQSADLMLDVPG